MRRTARHVVVDFAELSDPGRDPEKQVNEDAAGYAETALGHLAGVCAGRGGQGGGRAASQTAVRTIVGAVSAAGPDADAAHTLAAAIERAGTAVHALGGSAPDPARPGATCVAALVAERGAVIAHVGDSRVLLIRGGTVHRLTRDHSLVEELVAAGVLAPKDAGDHPEANKITRALGIAPTVNVELRPGWLPLLVDDVLLLVTDGVTDLVADADLRELVRTRLPLGAAVLCQAVIELANARGGHDNATVQALHVLEVPARPATAATVIDDTLERHTEVALPLAGDDRLRWAVAAEPGLPTEGSGRTHLGPAPTIVEGNVTATEAPPRPTAPEMPEVGVRRTAHHIGRPIIALALVLLVTIAAVAWLRHRRATAAGEAPPALVIESAAAPAVPATLEPVGEAPPPDSPAPSAPAAPATSTEIPAEAPTGSVSPSRFE